MGYRSGTMETVANELILDVHGWQLNITIPYNDGGDDGLQANTGIDQLSRRLGAIKIYLAK